MARTNPFTVIKRDGEWCVIGDSRIDELSRGPMLCASKREAEATAKDLNEEYHVCTALEDGDADYLHDPYYDME